MPAGTQGGSEGLAVAHRIDKIAQHIVDESQAMAFVVKEFLSQVGRHFSIKGGVMSPLPRRLLACALLLLAGCGHAPSSSKDPESAANAFFSTLAKGDGHGAYDSAAFGFQAAQTYAGFMSNAQQLGLVGAQAPAWKARDIHENDARLEGEIVSQAGAPVHMTVTLTADADGWKLFSLKTATAPDGGETENRFTLVGKGTGFNDVYHQPMPSEKQLEDLVHDTMAKFNAAVQSGDFHDFYHGISQQWKDGQRMTGEAAAGVTEKMLTDHFHGFIEQKIDVSAVSIHPPVWDHPPLINQDGLLDLDGHFDLPAYRVNFSLEYAYELPRWRLFGINVSLTN